MKCKYEHNGDCCNAGADQYMRKCKKPCEFIWPLSNADHIRSMTDEELAEWLENVDCFNCECCVHQMACRFEHDAETVYYEDKYDCLLGRMDWLKQPYEEEV